MPILTIVVKAQAFDLPNFYEPGQAADSWAKTYLNGLRLSRLRTRIVYWLDQQPSPPSLAEAQAKLNTFDHEFDFAKSGSPIITDEDVILAEALRMAEDAIRAKLASDNLPVPRSLRDHAQQLIDFDPSFSARARARIEATALVAIEMASTLSGANEP